MGNILDAKEFFRANVNDEILATIVRTIQDGTRDAARQICDHVREGIYTKHVARDLFPHTHRATVETRFFDLAAEFPIVEVTSWPNKTLSNYHTEMRVGNVVMTASAVVTPYGMVREADFRNSYAGSQMPLFDLDGKNNLTVPQFEEQPSNDDLLYGIILYCAAENNRFEIGSVRVGFPNNDCTAYRDKMDLMRLFPETAKKTDMEQIQDQAIVNLLLDEADISPAQDKQLTDERI